MDALAIAFIEIIVTHDGRAHRDEFIACCLLLAAAVKQRGANELYARCPMPTIYRDDPLPQTLGNPNAYCVDVGREWKRAASNFDHHQMDGTECALDLIAAHLGLRASMSKWAPWAPWTSLLDTKGPQVVQRVYEMGEQAFWASMSPIEAQVLQQFGDSNMHAPGEPIYQMMLEMGRGWIEYWELCDATEADLVTNRGFYRYPLGGIETDMGGFVTPHVLVVDTKEEYSHGAVDRHLEATHDPKAPVVGIMSPDDRGDGWSLLRLKDCPIINFKQVRSSDWIFVHNNGFIGKTKAMKPSDALEMFRAAMIKTQLSTEWIDSLAGRFQVIKAL